ncbi:MAG: cytochrome c [Bryobacteraceae bacterium]
MRFFALFFALLFAVSAAGPPDRNPAAPQSPDVQAGEKLFREHCAQCHGALAQGTGRAPALRTAFIHNASPDFLMGVLKNGILRRGMPSWSSLPEPMRRQIVAYLKQLE